MTRPGYLEPYPETRGDTFGMRGGEPGQHRGTDTAPGGLPALFPADGVIVVIDWYRSLGNVVVAQAGDGKYMGIAHLANSTGYRLRQQVRRLEPFGAFIGNTGTQSSGRHMHSTLGDDILGIVFGHVQDPLAYYAANPPSGFAGLPNEGSFMALTDNQQTELYNALVRPNGEGQNYFITDSIIQAVREILAGNILYPNAGYLAFPALANVVRGLELTTLEDEELAAIAKATVDEQDRRTRERLG